MLLRCNAVPIQRDYKSRKPRELAVIEDLKEIMKREETLFEEKFSGNSLLLRKTMVLDNFDKLKNKAATKKDKKKNFDKIEEDS